MKERLWNILIAFDQLIKTVVYGGNPDVTISHVIGVKTQKGTANWLERKICCLLNKLDVDHCKESIELDEEM